MARVATAVREEGSRTKTALVRAQETQARRGLPAKTKSAGPAGVSRVATTRRAATSMMLMEEEIWLTTQSSLEEANRAVTGSKPTATLPTGSSVMPSFEQAADHVDVVARSAAGMDGTDERVRGRYLVGAEGARSVVRKGLGIEFDIYGGTHQPDYVKVHERLSQEFFLRIHAKGLFTKRSTKQLYDPQANQFLPDRFVKGKIGRAHV